MAACLLTLCVVAAATGATARSIPLHSPAVTEFSTAMRLEQPREVRSLHVVESEALVRHCQNGAAVLQDTEARTSQCSSTPEAAFRLRYLPDGTIEVPADEDHPFVPSCALRNPLNHRVEIRSACEVIVAFREPPL